MQNPHPLHFKLLEEVGRKRTENFRSLIKTHAMEHYVCENCLQDYINGKDELEEKNWKIKHVKKLISYIERYENFHFRLTTICSKLNYTLKLPDNKTKDKPKVFFLGNTTGHSNVFNETTRVFGFATENPTVVQNFLQDHETIKNFIREDLLPREKMITYLKYLTK